MTKLINAEEARGAASKAMRAWGTAGDIDAIERRVFVALDALPDAGGQGWTNREELVATIRKGMSDQWHRIVNTDAGFLAWSLISEIAADIALSRPSPPITEAGYEAAARVLQQRFRSLYGGDRAVAADALDIARQMVDAATKTREG